MTPDRVPADALPDELLAVRVAARDQVALAQLYDRYARPIYALAMHALGAAEAEEVVQEVFLTLWNKVGQYDPSRRAFGAWFMAVARHRVLDELRRRGYQQRLNAAHLAEDIVAGAVDHRADVEEEAWQRERGAAVAVALRDLPPEQRKVLVLAYFGGLSHSAMAQHLGLPLGTVKKRVRLGMKKLRLALDALAPERQVTTGAAGQASPARAHTSLATAASAGRLS